MGTTAADAGAAEATAHQTSLPALMTRAEVAARYGIAMPTVGLWAATGRIPAQFCRGRWMRSQIEAHIRGDLVLPRVARPAARKRARARNKAAQG